MNQDHFNTAVSLAVEAISKLTGESVAAIAEKARHEGPMRDSVSMLAIHLAIGEK